MNAQQKMMMMAAGGGMPDFTAPLESCKALISCQANHNDLEKIQEAALEEPQALASRDENKKYFLRICFHSASDLAEANVSGTCDPQL